MTPDPRALAEAILDGDEWAFSVANATTLARYALDREAGWQPIATAPKDGTRVFVLMDDRASGIQVATSARWYWIGEPLKGWWQDYRANTLTAPGGHTYGPYRLTHWMPIPTPPRGAATGDADGR